MRRHRTYYAPPDAVNHDGTLLLPDEEWRHAVRVMRCRAGDEIAVVNGVGMWHRVRLTSRSGHGEIVESRADAGEPDRRLTVALALLKNPKRYQTFMEKAVELGASTVIPLLTERTQAQSLRPDRAQRILVAAMKQCGRSRIPELLHPQPLDAVLQGGSGQRMVVCMQQAPARMTFGEGDITILVGPEGGFTDEEITRSMEAGAIAASLSQQRLRAETAAIVAMAIAMLSPIQETGDRQRR